MGLRSHLKSMYTMYTIYTPRRKKLQPPRKNPGVHNGANIVGVEHRYFAVAEGKYVSQWTGGWHYRAARTVYCAASYVKRVRWT